MRRRTTLLVVLALALAGCDTAGLGPGAGGGPAERGENGEVTVRLARASWDTGFMQAAIHQLLLEELGYDVTDPAEQTRDAATFYPALARGDLDLWANGWFPLHEIYLDSQLVTGQRVSEPIEPVGTQVPAGARQGFLADRATAEDLGITSVADLADPDVAATFDDDGDGLADLLGCNEGWGCNLAIEDHLVQSDWGSQVEQVVGDYGDLMDEARRRVEAGEPVLFYTWTPNWTVDVMVPGEDVVWLEAPPLPDEEADTTVDGLDGCATGADACQLGWPVNDIRAVGNRDFLDANPTIRRLLEVVEIPLQDIADQNARMAGVDEYSDQQVRQDAADWIEDNRDLVDEWLDHARGS